MKVLGVNFFLSDGLYGRRDESHRDMYQRQPGWLFIEWGSRTLELDWEAGAVSRAVFGALRVPLLSEGSDS